MAFTALAKLKRNSVPTTIAAPGISAAATTIPVTELSRFYDVDGTLITRGIMIGGDNANSILPEEITITGASGTSGAGNLTGATRGVTADGTIGAAYAWPAGTNIAVTLTISWWNIIKDNFTECFQRDGSVAITGTEVKRSADDSTLSIYGGSGYPNTRFYLAGKSHATTAGKFQIDILDAAKTSWNPGFTILGGTNTPTPAFAGFKRGAISVADGGTITHGCGTTPTAVVCTPTTSGEMVSVTSVGATTFTVAIKKHDGSAGTTATVYWMAWL